MKGTSGKVLKIGFIGLGALLLSKLLKKNDNSVVGGDNQKNFTDVSKKSSAPTNESSTPIVNVLPMSIPNLSSASTKKSSSQNYFNDWAKEQYLKSTEVSAAKKIGISAPAYLGATSHFGMYKNSGVGTILNSKQTTVNSAPASKKDLRKKKRKERRASR